MSGNSRPLSLLPAQRESIIGFKTRWQDPNTIMQDAVSAFENKDKAEGRFTFLVIMAFLAKAPPDPYHEIGQRVAGAALELGLNKPRVELLEWLDEAKLLFDFKDIADRVGQCKHRVVLEWFKNKILFDSDIQRRFLNPVDNSRPEQTPFSEVLNAAKALPEDGIL